MLLRPSRPDSLFRVGAKSVSGLLSEGRRSVVTGSSKSSPPTRLRHATQTAKIHLHQKETGVSKLRATSAEHERCGRWVFRGAIARMALKHQHLQASPRAVPRSLRVRDAA
jgi:hypothetical protein